MDNVAQLALEVLLLQLPVSRKEKRLPDAAAGIGSSTPA
jgi:hypothetical protein